MNFFRRRKSLELNPDNPSYKVAYLGNVATGAARPLKQPFNGVDEVLKSLNRLWAAHLMRPNRIGMQLTVCNDGLKVMTEQYGLVEYWAHRITFCGVHPDFPSVFVWIYRHDGKNMKPDLRFHGALCTKPEKAELIAQQLQEKIRQALLEFKREKLSKQRSRLRHENLLLKFGELADLFVHESIKMPQQLPNIVCDKRESQFACDDDVFVKPKVEEIGRSCAGSRPLAIKYKSVGARSVSHEFVPSRSFDEDCCKSGSSSSELSNNSYRCREQQISPSNHPSIIDYAGCCGSIQPKRKDLKSCSKNYRPNTSQIGAPKLHSIDEESEFLDEDQQRLRKPRLSIAANDSCSTLKAAKSVYSRASGLSTETAGPASAVQNVMSHAAERLLPANGSRTPMIVALDSAAEEAELSDDGVFCKASSSSSRESSDLQFTNSSSSSTSSSSTRTSQSITTDDDDDSSVSSTSVHSYDVDVMPSYMQQQQLATKEFVYAGVAPSYISSPHLTPSASSDTLPHTPVLLPKQRKYCDASNEKPFVAAADTTADNNISSSDCCDEDFQNMNHFNTLLLEKRLGRLALADLANS